MKYRYNRKTGDKPPGNLVQTIDRVNQLLEILSGAPQGLSLGELSATVNLPKGTTHRLVSSLAYFDYVQQDPTDRKYKLGFKLAVLGNQLLDQIDLRKEVRPYLLELAQKTNEIAHLVVLDNDEALYIDKIQLYREGLHMSSSLGYRAPLYCTAVGKVLLAGLPAAEIERIIKEKGLPACTVHTITETEQLISHLDVVRNAGYALDNEEHNEGVRCVAAPILNIDGEVIAAISVSSPAIRVTLDVAQKSMKNMVLETAQKISQQLGYPLRQ
jgi:DNA-binding IclR family transcriptional regulator